MKNNKKTLKLVEHGLKSSTLAELNEKQIDALYNRLVESKKENKETQPKIRMCRKRRMQWRRVSR